MTKPELMQRCAMCAAPVTETYRPFCSRRCADKDLARWLNGRYAIPGPPASPEDMLENQAQAPKDHDDTEA